MKTKKETIVLPTCFKGELQGYVSRLQYLEIIKRYGKTYIDKVCRASAYKALVRDIEDLKDWEDLAIEKMAKDIVLVLSTILPRGERLIGNDELFLKTIYPTKELLYEAYKKVVGSQKAYVNKYKLYCWYAKFQGTSSPFLKPLFKGYSNSIFYEYIL